MSNTKTATPELKEKVSLFLNEPVLSAGEFDFKKASVSHNAREDRVNEGLQNYKKQMRRNVLFPKNSFLPRGLILAPVVWAQSDKAAGEKKMICAVTKSNVFLLQEEEDNKNFKILQEFDRKSAEIKYLATDLLHMNHAIDIKDDNAHAKIKLNIGDSMKSGNRELLADLKA